MACNNKDFRERMNADAGCHTNTHLFATEGAVTVLETHVQEIRWCKDGI